MNIGGKLIGGLLVAGAALAGSYVGEGLRDEAESGEDRQPTSNAQEFDLQRLLSSALPAIGLALLTGRPRTLFAFIGGMLIALFFGSSSQLQGVLSDLSVGRAGSKV